MESPREVEISFDDIVDLVLLDGLDDWVMEFSVVCKLSLVLQEKTDEADLALFERFVREVVENQLMEVGIPDHGFQPWNSSIDETIDRIRRTWAEQVSPRYPDMTELSICWFNLTPQGKERVRRRFTNFPQLLDSGVTIDQVLDVAELFEPHFMEVNGCVFFEKPTLDPKSRYEIQRARKRRTESFSPETISKIERWCNLQFMDHLFPVGFVDHHDPRLAALAEKLADAWRVALVKRFPDRRFVVECKTSASKLFGPSVTFYSAVNDQ